MDRRPLPRAPKAFLSLASVLSQPFPLEGSLPITPTGEVALKFQKALLAWAMPAIVAITGFGTGCAWIHFPRSPTAAELKAPPSAEKAPRHEQTTIHPLFSDHAVLQREMELPVRGWDKPGELVLVRLGEEARAAIADSRGRWEVRLPAMEAGGPHTMTIRGSREIEVSDLMIGEVWLCGGQSNMEWPVELTDEREEALEVVGEGLPWLRYFRVPPGDSEEPKETVEEALWVSTTPETVVDYSAAAFWFALRVHEELGIPIGLIDASAGGTSAMAWTSRESLLTRPAVREAVENYDVEKAAHDEAFEEYREARLEWIDLAIAVDPGNEGEEEGWHLPDYDDSDWEMMEMPAYWEAYGLDINGAVWFRLEVDVPGPWAGRDLNLHLGALDDFDVTYFNGEVVGETGRGTPQVWAHPREYIVPGELVREGRNLIATRIFDVFGPGGFAGEAEMMKLFPVTKSVEDEPEEEPIPLAGRWRHKVEYAVEPYTEPSPIAPQPPPVHWAPAYFHNAMIHPLLPVALRGVLWYQGESDTPWPYLYADLFPLLIEDWRRAWQRPDLPFYFVQIAPFDPGVEGDPAWAAIREVQLETWQRTPHTGLVVTTDIGDPDDIHPTTKRPVGERLARYALDRDYGISMEVSGPVFRLMETLNQQIRLHFDHTTGGLVTRGENAEVSGFEVAGPDRVFHPAKAEIDGETIRVMSSEVGEPVAVRYGWANAPELNLFNGEGLPASPFRTDRWEAGDD